MRRMASRREVLRRASTAAGEGDKVREVGRGMTGTWHSEGAGGMQEGRLLLLSSQLTKKHQFSGEGGRSIVLNIVVYCIVIEGQQQLII